MDHDLISLLGLDTVENILFGVSLNGKALVKSTTDHSAKFKAVLFRDWDTAKVKGTTEHAVMIGNDLAITNTTITPLAEHIVTSSSGTKWGGKGVMAKLRTLDGGRKLMGGGGRRAGGAVRSSYKMAHNWTMKQ